MFKLKFILPMFAFVLAIGMSFAFTSEAPGDLVIEIDGQYYQSPINCTGTGLDCTANILKDGDVLEIQVQREVSPGIYENVKTTLNDTTVFDFDDLNPIQQ